jgi:hypothetical protein
LVHKALRVYRAILVQKEKKATREIKVIRAILALKDQEVNKALKVNEENKDHRVKRVQMV